MELSTRLLLLAILNCFISIGSMMWKMNKNMDDRQMSSDRLTHTNHIKKSEE
jgi:hypothetical protein